MPLVDDRLAAWLRLLSTPQIGRQRARQLLERFGSPEAVFEEADAGRLEDLLGPAARHLATPPPGFATRWQHTRDWLCASGRRHLLTLDDPRFPPLLRETPDPPLLLFAEGRLELLLQPAIAIVGSRQATPQGRDNARHFAAHFADAGFTVVSGLALGIDAAAHEGALGRAGSTIGVVGTGLDQVYPVRHDTLAGRMVEDGLLLSEFPLGTPPRAEHFPMRNRLIAGLALGTVVVEAALRSGSLITARLAAECGRDVFAVPGSIHAAQSRGCHELLRQGAALVESAAEVIAHLAPTWTARCPPPAGAVAKAADASAPPDRLLESLAHEPCTLDQLVQRTGLPAAELGARLLELELEQRVARLPGGLFQRREHA